MNSSSLPHRQPTLHPPPRHRPTPHQSTRHRSGQRRSACRTAGLASLLIALSAAWPGTSRAAGPQTGSVTIRTGEQAYGDWRTDAPGVMRHLKVEDMPAPTPGSSSSNGASSVAPPPGTKLKAMPGFQVEQFMDGLSGARTLRTAPNGDIFVAQLDEGGQIVVIRADRHMRHPRRHVYASGLGTPYGIAFHPPGPDPQWIYIARADAVIRYRYRNGDLKPTGQPETVVSGLPGGGHWTRDLAFSADGGTMYVSVGSASNVAESMGEPPADLPAFEKERAPGAAWGNEEWRAAVLAFDPQGRNRRIFASGLRNCSGLAIRPGSDDLYCAVNERDRLGDNLPPDYVTRVASGAFYGWPWFYIGPHPDDRAQGSPRPELAKAVRIPDVLLQAHSAPLGMAFHRGDPGGQFPPQWKGDLFVALHGSWNRKLRTGYKIVRLPFENGRPTGAYQDFVVGFALDDERSVWGRPTGLTFAADGSLLFSDDSRGIIYRVSRPGMAH